METSESTDRSQSRALDLQPSSDGLGSGSDPFSSWDGRHRSALVAATAAASAAATAASTARAAALSTKSPAPYSHGGLRTEPSSDSLTERYTGPRFTHKISHGRLGFQPVYVSHIARNPYTTNDLSSRRGPIPGSSSGPVPGSSSSPGPDSSSDPGPSSSSGPGGSPGSGSGRGAGHGPDPGGGPGQGPGGGPGQGPGGGSGQGPGGGSGQGTDLGPGIDSRHSPGHGHGPGFNFSAPVGFRNPRGDLIPNYTGCKHHCHWEPQKQSWKFSNVSEPGAKGLWKPPKVEGKSMVLSETLPRGQCLLYNWEEERATNYLDQVPVMQDGSESFFFRHGHLGLLTLQPQSPMSSCTTQKDSYQPPTSHSQPIRGMKHERMGKNESSRAKKEYQVGLWLSKGYKTKPNFSSFPQLCFFCACFLSSLLYSVHSLTSPQGSVKPCWRCSCANKSGERLGERKWGGGGQKSGENALDTPQACVVKRCRQSRNPQGRTLRSSL
uniref:Sperm-associated antigen 8 n=1 Tax=Moschus moschiferus TaxID=68415 RepID=A0A8C6DQU8_MOSMO